MAVLYICYVYLNFFFSAVFALFIYFLEKFTWGTKDLEGINYWRNLKRWTLYCTENMFHTLGSRAQFIGELIALPNCQSVSICVHTGKLKKVTRRWEKHHSTMLWLLTLHSLSTRGRIVSLALPDGVFNSKQLIDKDKLIHIHDIHSWCRAYCGLLWVACLVIVLLTGPLYIWGSSKLLLY